MKINKEQYNHMKEVIKTKCHYSEYQQHKKNLIQAQKDGSQIIRKLDVRMAFDCFYASGLSKYATDTLYPLGIYDNHIQTALLKIVKELFEN